MSWLEVFHYISYGSQGVATVNFATPVLVAGWFGNDRLSSLRLSRIDCSIL